MIIILGILLIALISALEATVTWLVWNALADSFSFQHIGWWTAMLICVALTLVGSYFKRASQ